MSGTSATSSGGSRGLRLLVAAGSAVILVAGMRSAASIVAPTFLALMLTICVHPIHAAVRRRGWPRWTGTIIGMVLVYLILVVMTLAIVFSLARFATLIPQYADDATTLAQHATSQLQHLGVSPKKQQDIAASFDPASLSHLIKGILDSLASTLSSFFLVVTLLFFLALDAADFPSRLAATRHQPVVEALSSFATGTRRYLLVSTIFGFIVGVIDTAALALMGVPAPIVWGVLSFITNYIPNIGFVIGLVPPATLALLSGGPSLMIEVIIVYCVVNFVIQTLIQPKIVGDSVGLAVTITFLSLVFWAWVLGPLGALLAVPLTLLLKALLVESDPEAAWLLPVLSSGSPDPPTEGPASEV